MGNWKANDHFLYHVCRYTRKMGFLAELPEGHNYPRKLTFKMGENATGWR